MLHCTSPCSAAFNCTALHYTKQKWTTLHHTILHCRQCSAVLQYSAVHWTSMQCTVLHYTALQCTVVYFIAVQCTVCHLYRVLMPVKEAAPHPGLTEVAENITLDSKTVNKWHKSFKGFLEFHVKEHDKLWPHQGSPRWRLRLSYRAPKALPKGQHFVT